MKHSLKTRGGGYFVGSEDRGGKKEMAYGALIAFRGGASGGSEVTFGREVSCLRGRRDNGGVENQIVDRSKGGRPLW